MLKAGEIHGLCGSSGCGKSTLARIAVGLEEDFSGEVCFEGKALKKPFGASSGYRIQLIFQNALGSFNPRQKLGSSLALAQSLSASGKDQLPALLEALELDLAFLDRFPHQVSGGQVQRFAIARALLRSPAVLIADEPTSALDVTVKAKTLALLMRLRDQFGLSILVISHDRRALDRIADRVSFLVQSPQS